MVETVPKAIDVFIHNKLYIYLLEFWVTKTKGFRADKKAQKPSGFEEFVQFQEVFGWIDRIMYLTYHSRESRFHCAFFHHENTYFHLTDAALR